MRTEKANEHRFYRENHRHSYKYKTFVSRDPHIT